MDLDAVSPDERAYLLGLYLADGWVKVKGNSRILSITFQGDEGENVGRVGEVFRRAGLSPHAYCQKGRFSIELMVVAANITSLLPFKEEVHSMSHSCIAWVLEKGLQLPFIAGLIDGDGCVYVKHYCGRTSVFGELKVSWSFSQISYPFLVDFVFEYVNGLVSPGSRGASLQVSTQDGRTVSILESGREALVHGGIAKWSYKIANGLVKTDLVRKEIAQLRSRFLEVGEVARRLRLSRQTIQKRCRNGSIKHMEICSSSCNPIVYQYVVPVEEVQRLEAEAQKAGEARPTSAKFC